jgi:hypothetical protein
LKFSYFSTSFGEFVKFEVISGIEKSSKSIEIPNLTDGPILARSGPCGVARVELGHGVLARRRPGCAGDTGGEAPN